MAKLETAQGAGAGVKGAEATTAEERSAAAEAGAAEAQAGCGGGGDDGGGDDDDDDDFFGELERGKKAAKEAAKAKKKGRQASVAPTQAWPAVHLSPQAKPYGAPFEAQPKLSGHFAPSLANPNPSPNPNPNPNLNPNPGPNPNLNPTARAGQRRAPGSTPPRERPPLSRGGKSRRRDPYKDKAWHE